MKNNTKLLCIVLAAGCAKNTYADQCDDDFYRAGQPSADSIGMTVENEEQLESAKFALNFSSRCKMNFTTWADTVSANRATIEKNIRTYEDYMSSIKIAMKKCSNFDSCLNKFNKDGIPTLLGSPPDKINDTNDAVVARKIVQVKKECSCFVKEIVGMTLGVEKIEHLLNDWENKQAVAKKKQKELRLKAEVEQKIADEKEHINEQKRQIEKEKQEKMLSSVECKAATAKKEFCRLSRVSRMFQIHINHENEVGRQSGYVNKVKLHDFTASKINVDSLVSKNGAKYRQLLGKEITVSECQLKDDPPFEVRMPASFEDDVEKTCGDRDGVGVLE